MTRIKKLKMMKKKLEAFEPYETDENGRRIIRLHVNDSDSFLSPLSVEGVPAISDETAHLLDFYLKNMSVDSDEKLIFRISGHDFSESEMEIYRKAVRNYYKEEFIDVQTKFKENARSILWMIVLGGIFLGIVFFVRAFFGLTQLQAEPLDIAAWVFLWEAVDLFFIQRPKMRKEQLHNLKILEAEFVFQEKTMPEDEIPFAIQKLEDQDEE